MNGEIDAAGTAIEGALLSAAVEGQEAQGKAGADQNGSCLNCGATLAGAFCSNCGQKVHIHRTLSAVWHDILHGALHFDGKMWRTLPLLALRPGELTRRYIHGERAKFVSPMALFLFSLFLMFAVFSFSGSPGGGSSAASPYNKTVTLGKDAKPMTIAQLESEITQTEKALQSAQGDQRESLKEELERLKIGHNVGSMMNSRSVKYTEYLDETNDEFGSGFTGNTGWPWLDHTIDKLSKKAQSNPELLLYKLKSNGYKFAWLLIPLSLPFVWLVTLGARGHRFYDHAVFVTYSLSFVSLAFLLLAIAASLGASGWIMALLVLYMPFHHYKQLKYSYGFTRRGALFRLLLLQISMLIVLILFFLALLFLGILG